MTTTVTKSNENLNALAGKAAAEMVAAMQDHRSALAHAIKAGGFLIEAKVLVKHGEWEPWLEAHFTASERTARNCMRLAAESANPAVLEAPSVAAALAAIAKPKAIPQQTGPDPACEAFRALSRTFPNIRDRIKLLRSLPPEVRAKLDEETRPYREQINAWFLDDEACEKAALGLDAHSDPRVKETMARLRPAWLRLVELMGYDDLPSHVAGTTPTGSVSVDKLAAAFDATVESVPA